MRIGKIAAVLAWAVFAMDGAHAGEAPLDGAKTASAHLDRLETAVHVDKSGEAAFELYTISRACMEKGEGTGNLCGSVKTREYDATQWLETAAELGHPPAQVAFASGIPAKYDTPDGQVEYEQRATRYLKAASRAGYSPAFAQLGARHLFGGKRDSESDFQAIVYYSAALYCGHPNGKKFKRGAEERVSLSQAALEKAQSKGARLATEYCEGH